jgi:hypothetical protein
MAHNKDARGLKPTRIETAAGLTVGLVGGIALGHYLHNQINARYEQAYDEYTEQYIEPRMAEAAKNQFLNNTYAAINDISVSVYLDGFKFDKKDHETPLEPAQAAAVNYFNQDFLQYMTEDTDISSELQDIIHANSLEEANDALQRARTQTDQTLELLEEVALVHKPSEPDSLSSAEVFPSLFAGVTAAVATAILIRKGGHAIRQIRASRKEKRAQENKLRNIPSAAAYVIGEFENLLEEQSREQ